MTDRYPAPRAQHLFSEEQKLTLWADTTRHYAADRIREDEDLSQEADRDLMIHALYTTSGPTVEAVREAERSTGHDVVAFLSVFTEQLPEEVRPYIHFGLTSSDLVERSLHTAIYGHMNAMWRSLSSLIAELGRWEAIETVRAGRTHGQIADLTSLDYQFHVHRTTLRRIAQDCHDLVDAGVPTKSPGPTGHSPLRIPVPAHLKRVPSTQVIPRDWLLKWATIYLRLACEIESIATMIRCGARQEIGELFEGGYRIGSSSMPTKRNPVESERLCGLARVARGHFMTLAENVALWDDRDISNSSVERIAVPGLASTVEFMIDSITNVVTNLQVDYMRMVRNARSPFTMASLYQSLAQKHFGIGPVEAGNLMRRVLDLNEDFVDQQALYDEGFSEDAVYAWRDEVARTWREIVGDDPGNLTRIVYGSGSAS